MRLAGDDGMKWQQDCLYAVELVELGVVIGIVIIGGEVMFIPGGVMAGGVMLAMGDIIGVVAFGPGGAMMVVPIVPVTPGVIIGAVSLPSADGARMMAGSATARPTPAAITTPTITTTAMSVPVPPAAPPPAPAAAPPAAAAAPA